MDSAWHFYGIQPCCGQMRRMPAGCGYGPYYPILCPWCGGYVEPFVVRARWRFTGAWWNPWTWGQGAFEYADASERKRAEYVLAQAKGKCADA